MAQQVVVARLTQGSGGCLSLDGGLGRKAELPVGVEGAGKATAVRWHSACFLHARARTHTHTNTHTRTHSHTHARTHALTHACMHTQSHARMHARTHTFTHASKQACTHAHTKTHVHAHTHTYTHTHTQVLTSCAASCAHESSSVCVLQSSPLVNRRAAAAPTPAKSKPCLPAGRAAAWAEAHRDPLLVPARGLRDCDGGPYHHGAGQV